MKLEVKTYKGMTLGQYMSCEVDGLKFRFTISDYQSIGGYANIIIIDEQTHERFLSYGHITVHGHTFISYWRREYSDNRDNYICTTDLIVKVI